MICSITKPLSSGATETVWMTVRMKTIGSGVHSTRFWSTEARTVGVKTARFWKQSVHASSTFLSWSPSRAGSMVWSATRMSCGGKPYAAAAEAAAPSVRRCRTARTSAVGSPTSLGRSGRARSRGSAARTGTRKAASPAFASLSPSAAERRRAADSLPVGAIGASAPSAASASGSAPAGGARTHANRCGSSGPSACTSARSPRSPRM
mmetsp:Transcript_5218/g.18244  ORF Transcript_5218/g.18244 Transcript_5218/m.18244 type:complete len:207 (+) Transcript_5218:373-993(+)